VRDETRCSVPLIKVQIVPFFVSYLLVAAGCSSNKPKGVTGATETAKTSPFPASDFETTVLLISFRCSQVPQGRLKGVCLT
jgi:hypothetical protein